MDTDEERSISDLFDLCSPLPHLWLIPLLCLPGVLAFIPFFHLVGQ